MVNRRLSTFLTSISSCLEYYDFVLYGMMMNFLIPNFFPSDNKHAATLQALLVFALGYVCRIIGGVLFGALGDKWGRKNTFILVLLVMSLATFGIGCLPSYSEIGIFATISLVILRSIQSLSVGAEIPGAITYVSENVGHKNKSFHVSFIMSGCALGSLLATVFLSFISYKYTTTQIIAGIWRWPFYFGGILTLFSLLLRKSLQESLEFSAAEKSYQSIISMLNPRVIYKGSILAVIWSILVIFYINFPRYLQDFYSVKLSDTYSAMSIGLIFSALSLPICGYWNDIVGGKRLLAITGMIFLFTLGWWFRFADTLFFNGFKVSVICCCYQLFISLFAVVVTTELPKLFPIKARYTGVAICYNFSFLLSSLLMMAITHFSYNYQNSLVLFIILSFALLISYVAYNYSTKNDPQFCYDL